ncbi:UDP-3-O-(3-hydroxymyristoyl)glucosamine N-acyltransferase [Candidatus Auribacterota bacterium]
MSFSTGEVAKAIGAELIGNNSLSIEKIGEVEDCEQDGVMVLAINAKSLKKIKKYAPKIVVLLNDIPELQATKLITKKGKEVLIELLNLLYPKDHTGFISPRAVVADSADIGINAKIYPGVVIGEEVKIGENTVIHPNTVIYDRCTIGSNVIIHANCTIGADGYGYIQKDGKNIKIPQVGTVIIKDDVEIGAGCTVDRATLSVTVVGEGTKLDNMVHIGHNAVIGKNCILVGGVRISGSSTVEDNVMLLGAAALAGHNTVGANSLVYPYTVVSKDFPANSKIYATPIGDDYSTAIKRRAYINKLPEMIKRIKALEKKLDE